jgi:YVTN family beta-propeller protein
VVDLTTNTVTDILGLGYKDLSIPGSGLDATNEGDSVSLSNYPFLAAYMPDAITSYEIGGTTYLITANEGDAREYDALVDESRLGDSDYLLDAATFPNGDILKANVGRIKTINTEGDTDNDGDFDEIYVFGGRSFTIWNGSTGTQVYDSGDDFESITEQDPIYGAIFNATDDDNDFKDRSDDKGPEPEAVITAGINGQTYAFIALERIGGIMVYDVTDPSNPVFIQYVNNRDVNMLGGDLAPEGLVFVPFTQSPTGTSLLVVANEVSSTVSVYEIGGEVTGEVVFVESNQGLREDGGSVSIALEISGVSPDSTVSVDLIPAMFATADEASDFTQPASLTVTFGPGITSQSISIDLTNDSDAENDEYFSYRLGNGNGVNIGGDDLHTVYILDDDRTAPVATQDISLELVTSFATGIQGDDAAEIVAYDSASQRLFASNSEANAIDVIDFSDPANPALLTPIDISALGAINSVAIYDGIVAAAIENNDKQMPGLVAFYNTDGTLLSQVTVGALPDMVVFTPDGQTVLTANEGEPSSDYLNDPEGSVSIIDLSGGVGSVTQANVSTADFTSFNGLEAVLRSQNIRIFGPNASAAQDLEPEYIAISPDGSTAYVTCQENNALVVVDIATATVSDLIPLGLKDHSLPGNGLDAEDRSEQIRLANYPIFGMYMPDAIASYEVAGTTYLVTANEGDAREYDAYEEEDRLGDLDLDPTAFPDADLLQESIGRLTVTLANGDTDGDGDYDAIWAYGARSFSIWNGSTGALVYDSGDELEQIIAADPKFGPFFNSTNDELELKNRSDNKGPEPEGVVVGAINQKQYAFIGLERIGGVMVYDVTDPAAPFFVDYASGRDTASDTGDLAPEGLVLIPNAQSPDGKYYLVVANEVSSTLSIFEVMGVMVGIDAPQALRLRLYPNPAQDGVTVDLGAAQGPMTARVLTLDGRAVKQQSGDGLHAMQLNLRDLSQGVYLIEVETARGIATQKLIVR